jgi:hypothetical protein
VTLDYLSGGVKPSGRATCLVVDHLGPWLTGSLVEKPAFTRVGLSDVRLIMVIMRVLVELLCQAVIGQIPILECLLSDACERLRLHPVMSVIK